MSIFNSKIVPFMRKCGKNPAEPGRPQMTIWRKRIACLYRKLQTHRLTICNTFCFSTTKTVAGTHLNVTLCVHSLPRYLLNLHHLVTYVLLLHYHIVLSGSFVNP